MSNIEDYTQNPEPIREDCVTPNAKISYVLSAPQISTDFIVNGFSIKETILSVLGAHMHEERADILAQQITDIFSVKMGINQGLE